MSPAVAYRLLLAIGLYPQVRSSIAQFLNVYSFLFDFVGKNPTVVADVCGLLVKFPACAEVAGLLVSSGLFEALDSIAFARGSTELQSIFSLHAFFGQYALTRDYFALIGVINNFVWRDPALTQYALAALYAISGHVEVKRQVLAMGVMQTLAMGSAGPHGSYVQAIMANCST
jgi:hypothetical protein